MTFTPKRRNHQHFSEFLPKIAYISYDFCNIHRSRHKVQQGKYGNRLVSLWLLHQKGNCSIAVVPFCCKIAYFSYDFRTFLVVARNNPLGKSQNLWKSLGFPMTFAPSRRNHQHFSAFYLKIAYISYDFCSGEQIAGRVPGTIPWKSLIIYIESTRIRES